MKYRPILPTTLSWLLPLVLWVVAALAHADDRQRALELYEGDSHYLNGQVMLFEDPSRQLTLQDILSPAIDKQFKVPAKDYLSFGFSKSVMWMKLQLSYPNGAPNHLPVKEWFLEIARVHLDMAEIYMVDQNGHVESQSSDTRKPFAKKTVKYVNSVFPIKTRLGDSYTVYLRIANTTSFFIPLTLWQPEAFIEKAKFEQLAYGIFYGGMLVMILYNLFVFYSVHDKAYLYYIAYLTTVTLFEFLDIGHGMNLITHGPEIFTKAHIPIAMYISMAIAIQFARTFLDYPRNYPVMDRVMQTWMAILLISIPLSYLLDYFITIQAVALLATISLFGMMFVGFYAWYRKNENAMYFSLAWLFNVGGFLVYASVANGLVPPSNALVAAAPMGVFMEAVMFSFALAERIKRIERSELAANQRAIANLASFRSVFDNALEGIYQLSLKGRFTNANPAFARMLGYQTANDVASHSSSIRQLLFPEPAAMLGELAHKGSLQRELHFTDSQGRDRLAALSAQLIRANDGAPSHIEGTFVDLTDRLERDRVQKDRLRERRERQLALQATDEKSNFLKSISYEIRTPLAAIMGFSESLRMLKADDPEHKMSVDTVLRNSHRLLQLINDILDFSKIEAGKMPLEQIDTDLPGIIDSLTQRMQGLSDSKNVPFRSRIHYPIPRRITSDPTRLRQLLENLCLHAVDVTADGAVELDIRWDEAHSRLCVRLADHGPTLGMRQIQQMFQAFGRNDTIDSRPAVLRSGLGVIIANQLARMMGGNLVARPADTGGTCFELTLPASPGPKDQWLTAPAQAKAAGRAKGSVPALRGHILLAEDNAVNQQLIQRVIRKTGAEVTVAGDGQQALDAARGQRFSLILMDVNMPVMGGLEATRALRAEGYDGPIHALTAEQGEAEIAACLAAGCNGHLSKPLELDRFYTVLEQELSREGNDLRQSSLH